MPESHGPDGPEHSIAAAVDSAADALLSVWDRAREQAATRLSGSQLRAMLVVELHDGINLRGLASALGAILSSASRLCDRLVAAGLVEREPGRLDRREISLRLTPTGRAVLAELRAERRQLLADVLGRMSAAGRTALLTGLQEFHAVADADNAGADNAGADSDNADSDNAGAEPAGADTARTDAAEADIAGIDLPADRTAAH
jgi:DNA-binding MarR family transcriptional regulator